jgi:hypothetical protein
VIAAVILASLFFSAPASSLRAIQGTVIDARSHAVLPGASISLPDGKRVGYANRKGQFRVELPDVGWPADLLVTAPGHAPQHVPLPHVAAEVDLKTIPLSAEARLRLILPPQPERIRWRLLRLVGGKGVELLREGSVEPTKTEATIDGLPGATCSLILRGSGPLQQKAIAVSPREGETTDVHVVIVPTILHLAVESGGRRQGGAVIQFVQHGLRWAGLVVCDDHGVANEEMWEPGDYYVGMSVKGKMGFSRLAPLMSDTGAISWTFDIPAHRVVGRVIDSRTHEPLRDVKLTLSGTAPAEGGMEGLDATSDQEGRFEFQGIPEGKHTLQAYLKGYRYDQVQEFQVKEDDRDYETEVSLESLRDAHSLIVLAANGAAVASADVFFVGNAGVELMEHTDAGGRVTLFPRRAGVVFVVPPEGSLAFSRIPMDLSDDVTLRVPPQGGLVDLIAQSSNGEPIPDLFFVLRVNGMMIPPEVFADFAAHHGLTIRTDRTGHARLQFLPVALYELWPVRSPSDVDMLFSGNPPQPAASMSLDLAPQTVTMTFQKRPAR